MMPPLGGRGRTVGRGGGGLGAAGLVVVAALGCGEDVASALGSAVAAALAVGVAVAVAVAVAAGLLAVLGPMPGFGDAALLVAVAVAAAGVSGSPPSEKMSTSTPTKARAATAAMIFAHGVGLVGRCTETGSASTGSALADVNLAGAALLIAPTADLFDCADPLGVARRPSGWPDLLLRLLLSLGLTRADAPASAAADAGCGAALAAVAVLGVLPAAGPNCATQDGAK